MTRRQRAKISAALKGRKFSVEHRRALSRARKGKPLTEAQRVATHKVNTKKRGTTWKMSLSGRRKISSARRGMKFSVEHKRHLAEQKIGKVGSKSNRWVKDRSLVSNRNRPNRNFTLAQKHEILERDGRACRICGSRFNLEIDHIVPIAAGGMRDLDNGRVLCRPCHDEKRKRDWMMIRQYRSRGKKVRVG